MGSLIKALVATSVLTNAAYAEVFTGSDLNSVSGADVDITGIYAANRGSSGGGDQSLQFGDVVYGGELDDVLIGGLGIDVLLAGAGDDVIIGGTEDFNGFNRDRAFGQDGDDSFLWAPGDGNDFFNGGSGVDVLVMGLIGESKNSEGEVVTEPVFAVNAPGNPGSQDFDGIFLLDSGLPVVNPLGPGFCEVVERDEENEAALSDLKLDHLVRFILRGKREAFNAADPSVNPDDLDDGLRVAVHLKDVEFLVCANEAGDAIRVLDLREIPARETDVSQLPSKVQDLLIP